MIAATCGAGGHSNNPLDETLVGSSIDEGQARPLVARGSGYRMDIESENFVLADPVGTREGKTYTHEGKHNFRTHNLVEDTVIGFSRTESWGSGGGDDVSPPTRSAGHGASNNPAVAGSMGVRRLTPLECERLQGWPDDHTRYTHDGREIPDSHRYRMIGNGVVAPVAEWLGHRLVEADRYA